MKELRYNGVLEVGGSEPETVHDCTKPREDQPSAQKVYDLDDGDGRQLGTPKSRRSRLSTGERDRNRSGGGHNVT